MNNNDYNIIFYSIDIFIMFATKHILYDLSEASKITRPGLGTPMSYPKFPHAYGANDEGAAWITSTGLPQTNYSYIRIRKS